MSQFEASFVDEHTQAQHTITFWRGEPIIYHAPHLAKQVLTHVDTITKDYFVAACSCTGRMVPRGPWRMWRWLSMAQRWIWGRGSYGAAGWIMKTAVATGRAVPRLEFVEILFAKTKRSECIWC